MDRLEIITDLDLGVDMITAAAKKYGELYPEHKSTRVHRLINCVQGVRGMRDVIEQEWRMELEAKKAALKGAKDE